MRASVCKYVYQNYECILIEWASPNKTRDFNQDSYLGSTEPLKLPFGIRGGIATHIATDSANNNCHIFSKIYLMTVP